MEATGADPLRSRLEGKVEVLEVTRVRYRALVGMVNALFWQSRLRRNAPLLHQVALAQPLVDGVLEQALRRAAAEGWDPSEPTTRLVHEVANLRAALKTGALKRLHRDEAEETLPELLIELEAALAGPRKIEPGQKWATAQEILPWSLPELIRASERGDLLERLLKRPMELQGPLPFTRAEAAAIARAVPEAEAALQAVWKRVDQVDPSGALQKFLARRSRRAPLRAPRTGPEALLRAAFWLDYAKAAVRRLVEPRVAPVPVAEAELWPLLEWQVALQQDAKARLGATPDLPDAKAGLFELAHELNRTARLTIGVAALKRQGAQRNPAPSWEGLAERARRADALRTTAEAAGVRHALARFVRMAEPGANKDDTLWDSSLEALVLKAAATRA